MLTESIDENNKHVREVTSAYVAIVGMGLMFKVEYPRTQSTHPWALIRVRDQHPGNNSTYFGFIPDTVGDALPQCPGFEAGASIPASSHNGVPSSSQETARAGRVAPVPLDRRTSSNGGVSSAALSAQLARERKSKLSSVDPSRSAAARAGLEALAGVGIRSSRPILADRSSSPPRPDSGFPGTGYSE